MPLHPKQILWKSIMCGAFALSAIMFALPGCTSSSSSKQVFADEANDPNPDVYPDFSKPLTSAMPQMSDEEAANQQAQLSALAARRKSGAISEAEYNRRVAELRKLNEETKAQN